MLRLFIFFSFMAPYAVAQEGYPNSCDPTDIFECQLLTMNYATGHAPFPKDIDRAHALNNLALQGAKEGCGGANYDQCYNVLSLTFSNFITPPPDAETTQQQIDFYRQSTELGCTQGHSLACYWRSILFDDPNVRFFALEQARRNGQDPIQFALDVEKDKQGFLAKAKTAARIESQIFRQACDTGDLTACGELGDLLHERELETSRPFEDVDLLLQGCATGSIKLCNDTYWRILTLATTEPEKPVREKAIATLESFCFSGNGAACNTLTQIFHEKTRNLALWTQGCVAENAKSCERLGSLAYREYKKDKTVEKLDKAVTFFTQACDLNNAYACHMLEHISKG